MEFEHLLDRVMDLDKNIRHTRVCDMSGNVVCSRQRPGVVNLLTEEETRESLKYSVNSWKVRAQLADKIGKGRYVLAVYEKLRRVTLPLDQDHLLLVSFDNKGGQMDILEKLENELRGDYTHY
ncbi:MAG: hypothetical protein WAO91_10730 [Candidatus Nitrosotenuis sp.]